MESLRAFARDWALCLRFYTRLGWKDAEPVEMLGFAEALRALPLAGASIGGIGALTVALSRGLGLPPLVAATLSVGALVTVTGGLHEDGLADAADGFGGGGTPARKLEIMRDSRLGSYGGLALGLSLLLRVFAVAALAERATLLAAAATIARAAGAEGDRHTVAGRHLGHRRADRGIFAKRRASRTNSEHAFSRASRSDSIRYQSCKSKRCGCHHGRR
jgi:cobalamin synthase